MACGLALKRPYEYEEYLSGEGIVDAKRARTTHAHCSPFRAQLGTLAASLPATSTSGTSSALLQLRDPKERDEKDVSPFASIAGRTQLSSGQLESYLRAEVRYLRRRHLIPRRRQIQMDESMGRGDGNGVIGDGERFAIGGGGDSPPSHNGTNTTAYRAAPSSPTNNSGSDSDGESQSGVGGSGTVGQKTPTLGIYDRPQFSLKQVQMICERLLKQQEVRLRYEYETVLNQRLEEQHEQYVQFATEQLERQQGGRNAHDISYLS